MMFNLHLKMYKLSPQALIHLLSHLISFSSSPLSFSSPLAPPLFASSYLAATTALISLRLFVSHLRRIPLFLFLFRPAQWKVRVCVSWSLNDVYFSDSLLSFFFRFFDTQSRWARGIQRVQVYCSALHPSAATQGMHKHKHRLWDKDKPVSCYGVGREGTIMLFLI